MDAMAVACAIGRRFEGCSLVAYPDPVSGGAPWTIGWGNTCSMDGDPVRAGGVLRDQPQADALQEHALGLIRGKLGRVVGVALAPWEEGALLDFAFNLGSSALVGSTLLKLVNAGDKAGAAAQFCRWGNARVRGRLIPLPGLARRRAFERDVFLGRADPAGPDAEAVPAAVLGPEQAIRSRPAPKPHLPPRPRPAAVDGDAHPTTTTTADLNAAELARHGTATIRAGQA